MDSDSDSDIESRASSVEDDEGLPFDESLPRVRQNDPDTTELRGYGLDDSVQNGRKVEASFWDGTTDYTVVDVEKEEKEAEKRLNKFGDWLEEQELPEEFQLRVEEKD